MSTESASIRKDKRIVEHVITGFPTAKEALTFGNTVNEAVKLEIPKFIKFKQFIGSPDTKLAITKDWSERTVLKTSFLEIPDQNTSVFICDIIKKILSSYKEVHPTSALNIVNEIVREKPQPQFIG